MLHFYMTLQCLYNPFPKTKWIVVVFSPAKKGTGNIWPEYSSCVIFNAGILIPRKQPDAPGDFPPVLEATASLKLLAISGPRLRCISKATGEGRRKKKG